MAAMTMDEGIELMRIINNNTDVQTWTKPQIRAAFQSIEDRVLAPGTKQAIANDIEAAAPGVFNAQMKEMLFMAWTTMYARRQGLKV
jgi:Mlc titration factor MtfA (ptsG expression regulator)